jgi:Arc/MetJ-type ribon-helix-helix transcriptional regulator
MGMLIGGEAINPLASEAAPSNDDYMITDDAMERVRGWFSGRLPDEWQSESPSITVDREEVTVMLTLPDVPGGASEVETAEARAGRAKAFREETRDHRISIAREAEHRFGRKVSWGVHVGDREELFTHVSAPVMTRLKQPQRRVLDTLVEAGVARSRSEALAWCVRLVGQHEDDWLRELREAMSHVADVRDRGPA